jgi:pimeloyl-ACP methyl ester carboxylesterase
MLLTALLLVVAQPQIQVPPEALKEGLAIRGVARSGRIPFPTDAVHALIASGNWKDPKAGDELTLPGGEKRAWTALKAEANGSFSQGTYQAGYACFSVQRGAPEVMILEASGHGMAYVNGEPFAGDPYGNGYLKVPIALKQGANTLLFSAGRGSLSAKLLKPSAAAMLNMADLTLPDLVVGQEMGGYAGVIVMNATNAPMSGLTIQSRVAGGPKRETSLPTLPPLGVYKTPVVFFAESQPKEGLAEMSIALVGPSGMLDFQKTSTRVRTLMQSRKVTFISGIDGSVQYYGLVPAQEPGVGKALILTPHGAGVEGIGQADAFGPKTWANIVGPTNRRPFGFDWEDWGEEDAMEVLAHAQRELATDPLQTYLSGHSMGGHGTWHLGVNYPDRFAVIGPSAGWVSFFSYAGSPRNKPTNPVEELFFRAMNGSDTLALKRNFLMPKVYILHGDKDDNVPVTEARTMKEQLEGIGVKFDYHEQPGAGHWWDDDGGTPGTGCVDWPPMMKLFQDTRIPKPGDVQKVEFHSVDPGRSGTCHWVRIEAQNVPLALSSVNLERAPGRVKGKTENVSRLTILPEGVDWGGRIFVAELDGQTASAPLEGIKGKGLRFELLDGKWVYSGPAEPKPEPVKRHLFKSAFRNGAVLVYGTHGTPEENAWALAKARFDAEQFWYRGNGAFQVMGDDDAVLKLIYPPYAHPFQGNLVLYGNADTNSAYNDLLKGCPFRVAKGRIQVGDRTEKGEGLASIFLYPRTGPNGPSRFAMVGVVGGTGIQGMRATDRLPYFVSGVQYPDWCVFGPDVYSKGTGGVIGAGFFGDDWTVLQKQSAWAGK